MMSVCVFGAGWDQVGPAVWQMQGVASEQGTPGSNDWRARARAYSQ